MLVHQLLIMQKTRLKKDFDEKKITVEKYVEKTSLMNMEIKISERKICDEFCLYQIKNIMLSCDSLDPVTREYLKHAHVYEYAGSKNISGLDLPRTMNVFKNNEYILIPPTKSKHKYAIPICMEKTYKSFMCVKIESRKWLRETERTIDSIKKYCELICDKSGLKMNEVYIDCEDYSGNTYSQPDGIQGEVANLHLYEIYIYCKLARTPGCLTTTEKNFIATGQFKLESPCGYVTNPLTGYSERM